ncbi:MAG: hypothetical protein K2G88_06530 [Oscillospiraceae bacterium]|nr:hypothetical protein [Oscillospiraceae bacterium]
MSYIKTIQEKLKEYDINFSVERDNTSTYFKIPFCSYDNLLQTEIVISVSEKNNIADVYFSSILVGIEKSKYVAMLQMLNYLNQKYRFVRFLLYKDITVLVDYRFFMFDEDENVACENLFGTLSFFKTVIDDCIEDIMCII